MSENVKSDEGQVFALSEDQRKRMVEYLRENYGQFDFEVDPEFQAEVAKAGLSTTRIDTKNMVFEGDRSVETSKDDAQVDLEMVDDRDFGM